MGSLQLHRLKRVESHDELSAENNLADKIVETGNGYGICACPSSSIHITTQDGQLLWLWKSSMSLSYIYNTRICVVVGKGVSTCCVMINHTGKGGEVSPSAARRPRGKPINRRWERQDERPFHIPSTPIPLLCVCLHRVECRCRPLVRSLRMLTVFGVWGGELHFSFGRRCDISACTTLSSLLIRTGLVPSTSSGPVSFTIFIRISTV